MTALAKIRKNSAIAKTVRATFRELDRQRDDLVKAAELLSPGMASALERLLAGTLTETPVQFTEVEMFHLKAAAAALSIVNRTPDAATKIGRAAALVVASNPRSFELAKVTEMRRIAV